MQSADFFFRSHLFKNFSQFVVIHTVQGFGIVNKAEVDVFLELSCFLDDPVDVDNLISGYSAFSTRGSQGLRSPLESRRGSLPPNTSAQKVKLFALTRALELGEGKRINVYTDSKYAFPILHVHAAIWKDREMLSA